MKFNEPPYDGENDSGCIFIVVAIIFLYALYYLIQK